MIPGTILRAGGSYLLKMSLSHHVTAYTHTYIRRSTSLSVHHMQRIRTRQINQLTVCELVVEESVSDVGPVG